METGKIRLYLRLKWVIIGVVLGVTIFENLIAFTPLSTGVTLTAVLLAAAGALRLRRALEKDRATNFLVHLALAFDFFLIILAIYVGGSLESMWYFLLVFIPFIAGYIFGARTSLFYAAASLALVMAVVLLEYFNVIPHFDAFTPPETYWRRYEYIIDYLLGLFLLYFVGALASAYLTKLLEQRTREVQGYTQQLEASVARSRASEAEAQRAKEELEIRVRERTRELEGIRENLEKNVEARTGELEAARRAALHMLKDLKEDMVKLEAVDRLKTEFLSMVSHELRTPLTPIKGYLSLLLANKMGEIPAQQREALNILSRQSDHLQDLIESLLDISRLELGKPIPLSKEPLSVKKVIDEVVEAVRIMAESRGLSVNVEAAANTPTIVADEIKLKRVITNLIGNAIKFTPKGGEIRIRAQPTDSNVRLEVIDNGIGIAPELLEKVFEKFFQIDSSYTRAAGGIGMGLAIARELVGLHGGRIWAESRGAGKGSKFIIILPIGAA